MPRVKNIRRHPKRYRVVAEAERVATPLSPKKCPESKTIKIAGAEPRFVTRGANIKGPALSLEERRCSSLQLKHLCIQQGTPEKEA